MGCDFVTSPCLVGGGNGRDGSIPSYSKVSGLGCVIVLGDVSFLAIGKFLTHLVLLRFLVATALNIGILLQQSF